MVYETLDFCNSRDDPSGLYQPPKGAVNSDVFLGSISFLGVIPSWLVLVLLAGSKSAVVHRYPRTALNNNHIFEMDYDHC
jgi:hypothetical protein